MKIAIPGIKGSFHHIAATKFFGEKISINACKSFEKVAELLTNNFVDAAVLAIENSVKGAVLSNYFLIDTNNLSIHGEIYLHETYHFMALKGQRIKDIKEVWSHPESFRHCEKFLRKHPHIKIVEQKGSSIAANMINEKRIKGVAAIANKKTAEIYDLEILEKEIQTHISNTTRYFILKKNRHHHQEDYLNNKASLKLITENKIGNLAEILTILSKYNLNLSKIQSIPIIKKSWAYAIFIDLVFDDYNEYCQALLAIEKKVKELKILGEYPQNKIIFNHDNDTETT
ncbi:MAG: prephenate dehydratase [Flavobacteriaceae bacterium]|nr:prephenate dehydratase [Flavobacteriaceae bacterium]